MDLESLGQVSTGIFAVGCTACAITGIPAAVAGIISGVAMVTATVAKKYILEPIFQNHQNEWKASSFRLFKNLCNTLIAAASIITAVALGVIGPVGAIVCGSVVAVVSIYYLIDAMKQKGSYALWIEQQQMENNRTPA